MHISRCHFDDYSFFMNNLLFVMRVEDLAGVLADTELKCYQHTVFAEA